MDTIEMVSDNPQCVSFGLFMIWFSSITINLGPTFLREGFKKIKKKVLNHFVRKNFNDEKNEWFFYLPLVEPLQPTQMIISPSRPVPWCRAHTGTTSSTSSGSWSTSSVWSSPWSSSTGSTLSLAVGKNERNIVASILSKLMYICRTQFFRNYIGFSFQYSLFNNGETHEQFGILILIDIKYLGNLARVCI